MNCSCLLDGLGGSGDRDRERKLEENGVFSLNKSKNGPNKAWNGPKRAKIKIPFFAEILFTEHTLLEENILNEASLGGSLTISGTLHPTNQQQIQNHQHLHQN